MLTASFPSPSTGVLHLGPLPLRAYAFCIVLGIIAALLVAEPRLRARGAPTGTATEIATWAVPFGLVGARLYHVITTPDPYFGKGGKPLDAFAVWHGGLGIWGGIAGGFLGGYIVIRRMGLSALVCADAIAPALAVAQAIGRWGNYFNQELYGRPTSLPWAVRIDPQFRVDPAQATYHPTFLYESLWDLGVAGVCLWADRRFRLGKGRVFALYVALYCAGRAWIEALRIDEAHRFLGLRLNDYVSLALGLAAVIYLVARRGQREPVREPGGLAAAKAANAAGEGTTDGPVADGVATDPATDAPPAHEDPVGAATESDGNEQHATGAAGDHSATTGKG